MKLRGFEAVGKKAGSSGNSGTMTDGDEQASTAKARVGGVMWYSFALLYFHVASPHKMGRV